MPSVGPWELAIILVIVVIIFGVGKLPEIGGALGKGIKEFRTSASADDDAVTADKPDIKSTTTNTPIKEEL
ncbi:MAG TPA: twin-arginine translocase TatA/TatE family subunit [Thermomicrobiales bacterium]|nr:twin-arginine translocase TatA/TatE family subunit [Thermomicrobiales bacterium]